MSKNQKKKNTIVSNSSFNCNNCYNNYYIGLTYLKYNYYKVISKIHKCIFILVNVRGFKETTGLYCLKVIQIESAIYQCIQGI